MRGNIEQGLVFDGAFCLCVNPEKRIFVVAGEGLVEIDVVLVGELRFGSAPESARAVHLFVDGFCFSLGWILGVGFFFGDQVDRPGDVVRVALEELLDAPARKIF